ncbi:hypothetical protein [Pseudomonas moorei]|jgi:hypothetical protein|uniref:Uncharacterized protein n=1 Tax=Pseudomonas moorei TaxID=395599 RepID=A0A1H1IMD3_9PSED|nr:hypothetical protein [Pseudomonas moorei]KAB0495500.1 hypothetical protein F7R06_28010 [Pseudomonas moorei]SDR38834.1 hypothetical protein SAMN04490195_5618 [Pseudomonas moorei]
MSYFNRRGIFLQKLGPTVVDPNEVLVSMQFSLKEPTQDEEGALTEKLLDSTLFIASSNDGGQSFSIDNAKDVDGDGDIDNDDRAKLLALAKAYANIVRP